MKNLKTELQDWEGDKTLMVVFPHPDDETVMAGGLLMQAKKLGWKTIVVILTKGGAGKNMLRAGELKNIREIELKMATKILNVDKLILGDFEDGKLKNQKSKWSKWLNEQIEKYNPSWIVTYDHSGLSGHPDHISLSLELKKTSAKLWWVSIENKLKIKWIRPDIKHLVSIPTHNLSLGIGQSIKKYRAVHSHRSQYLPIELPLYRREFYHEVDPNGQYRHKFVEFDI